MADLQTKCVYTKWEKALNPADYLQEINILSQIDLKPDDVIVHKMRTAHGTHDRDGERFRLDFLQDLSRTLADPAEPKPMLIGHDHAGLPLATFFRSEVVELDGIPWMESYAYTVRDEDSEKTARRIAAGIYRYVSMGFYADRHKQLICDTCDFPIWSEDCKHVPMWAPEEMGERSQATWIPPAEAHEASIVYLPAQQGAQFIKRGFSKNPDEWVQLVDGLWIPSHIDESGGEKKWHETENEIRYRGVQGADKGTDKLKPQHVPEGHDPDSAVLQSLQFRKSAGWTLEKAQAWVREHMSDAGKFLGQGGIAMTTDLNKKASGDTSLPLAPEDAAWSWNAAAANEILGVGGADDEGADWARLAKAVFWRDASEPEKRESYKLPFARMMDGKLKAVWRGVAAANAAIHGARGGVNIPASDRGAVLVRVRRLYERFGKEWPGDKKTGGELTEEFDGEFSDIVWYSGEKEIAEWLDFVGRKRSVVNIMRHWASAQGDLSEEQRAEIKELKEVVDLFFTPEPPPEAGDPSEPKGDEGDPSLPVRMTPAELLHRMR